MTCQVKFGEGDDLSNRRVFLCKWTRIIPRCASVCREDGLHFVLVQRALCTVILSLHIPWRI
jgi:hypothetical protein